MKTCLHEELHRQTIVNRAKMCWLAYFRKRVSREKYEFANRIIWFNTFYTSKLIYLFRIHSDSKSLLIFKKVDLRSFCVVGKTYGLSVQ